MGILDWIILLIVAALLALAIHIYRKSGSCACGSGSCEGCAAAKLHGCKKCAEKKRGCRHCAAMKDH